MSTPATTLPLNQAVLLAADALEAMQEIPSVADLAIQAGVTRQYLYRLANREINIRKKNRAASPTGKTAQDPSKTGPQSHEDHTPSPAAVGNGTPEGG